MLGTYKHVPLQISYVLKAFFTIILPFAFVLLPTISKAEEEDGVLYIRCANNSLELGSYESPIKDRPVPVTDESVDVNALVVVKEDVVQGHKTEARAGSKILEKSCGSFKMQISATYYIPTFNGQGGGAAAFPTVSVSYGQTKILDNYRLDDCVEGDSHYPDCPQKWAQDVDMTFDGSQVNVAVTSRNMKHVLIPITQQKE